LGEIPVKGKEEAQEAYELTRASEVRTRIEAAAMKGLTRFVGRKQELEALRQAFQKVSAGSGQVLGIVGEGGVGKSRLILELKNRIPETEYSYLEGRCLHYGGSIPYLPILDVLKGYFQIEDEDREATIKKKVRNTFMGLDEKVEVVPPALHEVLSLRVDDEKYVQLSPQQRKQRTFEVIRDLLIRESQKKPLILAVEDLHWIDMTSQEFLDYLIGSLPTTRILLILLYRPEYTHQWGSKSYYGKIGLDPLSTKTSAELVQAILEGGDVAPEIGGLILGRAGGNPLFVEELTHSLVENGSIQKKDDHFVLTRKPSDIEVPDTIQGIIAARMDRVEENLKQIMQVASVIGREFAYRILATITGMREDLKASLLNLQGLEFIYEKQLFPELEYIFKHALTQEVAYNSLLVKRRKEIHERIGRAIEELYSEGLEEYYELLSYHYVRSENKDKAVDYLALASQKAAKANSMEVAASYFEQAMEVLDALPDTDHNRERRISLLVSQFDVFDMLLRHAEYYVLLNRYEPVAASINNPSLFGAFHACLGGFEASLGFLDHSIQTLTKAAELCDGAGNHEGVSLAYSLLQWTHLFKGNFDKVLLLTKDTLRKMEEHFSLRWYVYTLYGAALAYAGLGRWDEAEEEGKKALGVAQEFTDNSLISEVASIISNVYVLKGDLEQAIEYAKLGASKAQTPADEFMAQTVLARARCRTGEPNKGIEVLKESAQIARAAGPLLGQLPIAWSLSEGYLLAGEYEKASHTAEDVMQTAEQCGARLYQGMAHRILGEVALAINADEASPHLEEAIAVFQETRAENDLALAYSVMGRFHKQRGSTEQAREYLTKALEIFERLGTPIEPDRVRNELAELT
jgi:predicted ATPase